MRRAPADLAQYVQEHAAQIQAARRSGRRRERGGDRIVRFPARPLLAAAVAGLLASGCDYWKNLVDDKTVADAELRIKVTDLYTGWNLEDVTCKDAKRGQQWTTDPTGVIFDPHAG